MSNLYLEDVNILSNFPETYGYQFSQQVDHCWSWDQLRSKLAVALKEQPLLVPKSSHRAFDVTVCSDTKLLNVAISAFSNELISFNHPAFMGDNMLWELEILAWFLCQQNHHHLLFLLSDYRTANNSIILSFVKSLVIAIAMAIHLKQPICVFRPVYGCLITREISRLARWEHEGNHSLGIDGEKIILASLKALKRANERFVMTDALVVLAATVTLGSCDIAQNILEMGAEPTYIFPSRSYYEVNILNLTLRSRNHGMIHLMLQHGVRPRFSPQRTIGVFLPEEETNPEEQAYVDINRADMEIDDDIYHKDASIFTYPEFCVFRCPSLCDTFWGPASEWADPHMAEALRCTVTGRKPSPNILPLVQQIALYGAAEFDNFVLARELIKVGVDAKCLLAREYIVYLAGDKTDPLPLDPLEHAFNNRSYSMTKLLLDAGAYPTDTMLNLGIIFHDERTIHFLRDIRSEILGGPLHICMIVLLFTAIQENDREQVIKYVSGGADINGRVRHGRVPYCELLTGRVTPLMHALQFATPGMVELLWNMGARFKLPLPFKGSTEVGLVCRQRPPEMLEKLKFLLGKGAVVDEMSKGAMLSIGSEEEFMAPLQWLAYGLRLTEDGEEKRHAMLEAVNLLLDNGADINCRLSPTETPLQLATPMNYFCMAELLVTRGADVNLARMRPEVGLRPCSPLDLAVTYNNHSVVRLLLDHGAVCSQETFGLACASGNSDMADLLVDYGAERLVDYILNGETCLHHVCQRGDLRAAELLVRHGADVNLQCPRGTPLRAALQYYDGDRISLVKYLLRQGASPSGVLASAALWGDIEIAVLLLEAGAGVNERRGVDENTAIESAALRGRLEMVKVLINAGAEKDVKQGRFARAIELANKRGHTHIVKLLEEHL